MKVCSFHTNLLTFYEEVSYNLDRGKPVKIVYLNSAKSFDTVLHKHLIYKYGSFYIDEILCNWIKKLVAGACPEGGD